MNLASVLESQARTRGSKLAVRSRDGDTTYSELNDRAGRVAAGLAELSIGRGDRIAVLMRNSQRYLELLYAAARLGAIIVPINWRLTSVEVDFVVQDADAALIVADNEFLPALGDRGRRVVLTVVTGPPEGTEIAYESLVSSVDQTAIADDVGQDDVLVLMYTSGTTGRPKGAMLTHGNLLWSSVNQIVGFEFVATDIALVVAPMFHVGGLLIFTLPAIHLGATVVIHDQFEPQAVLDAFESDGVTLFFGAPTMFELLVRHLAGRRFDAPSLRSVAAGGAPLSRSTKLEFDRLFGLALTEGFGMTETSSMTTMVPPEQSMTKLGSVGIPAVHVDVRIADLNGVDVPQGTPGELLVRGPNVMPGYWRREKETDAAFWGLWLRTGDVAYMDDDGYVWLIDRVKDMIISGGENIYPKEIEQAIEAHPDIVEVAVIGARDDLWGEVVVAVVIVRPGASLGPKDVIDQCHGRVAPYKIPRRVFIEAELPKNAGGKVLKRKLRELISSRSSPSPAP